MLTTFAHGRASTRRKPVAGVGGTTGGVVAAGCATGVGVVCGVTTAAGGAVGGGASGRGQRAKPAAAKTTVATPPMRSQRPFPWLAVDSTPAEVRCWASGALGARAAAD